jgi:putative acetyltransferase
MPLEEFQIRVTNWSDPDGIALRQRQREEIVIADYRAEPGTAPSAEDVPIFLIILDSKNAPIACGGLRPLLVNGINSSHREAEIKRMFVVPEWRGRSHGVADLVLRELERHADLHGFATLKLETAKDMTQARRFYERNGFQEIERFGGYVDAVNSVCYAKELSRTPSSE